jgi:hypothetical protein
VNAFSSRTRNRRYACCYLLCGPIAPVFINGFRGSLESPESQYRSSSDDPVFCDILLDFADCVESSLKHPGHPVP